MHDTRVLDKTISGRISESASYLPIRKNSPLTQPKSVDNAMAIYAVSSFSLYIQLTSELYHRREKGKELATKTKPQLFPILKVIIPRLKNATSLCISWKWGSSGHASVEPFG